MPRFLGEGFPVGVARGSLTAAARRARRVAASMRAEGSPVWFVRSTFVPEEDSLLCLFDAPSADLVRELSRRARLPVERIVEAVDVSPDTRAGDSGSLEELR
jgi:hypothetical protein